MYKLRITVTPREVIDFLFSYFLLSKMTKYKYLAEFRKMDDTKQKVHILDFLA